MKDIDSINNVTSLLYLQCLYGGMDAALYSSQCTGWCTGGCTLYRRVWWSAVLCPLPLSYSNHTFSSLTIDFYIRQIFLISALDRFNTVKVTDRDEEFRLCH